MRKVIEKLFIPSNNCNPHSNRELTIQEQQLFASLCKNMDLVIKEVDGDDCFKWDDTPPLFYDLSIFSILDTEQYSFWLSGVHRGVYNNNGVSKIPYSFFNLCIYDILVEFEYTVTPTVQERIKSLFISVLGTKPTMMEVAYIYLSRFGLEFIPKNIIDRLDGLKSKKRKEKINQSRLIVLEALSASLKK